MIINGGELVESKTEFSERLNQVSSGLLAMRPLLVSLLNYIGDELIQLPIQFVITVKIPKILSKKFS